MEGYLARIKSSRLFNYKKYKKYILVGVLTLIFLYITATLLLFVVEPTSPLGHVFITNISDHQATVSWTTEKPTRGAVVLAENGKFPLLPFFAGYIFKDDGEKSIKRVGFYTVHQVTVDNLEPNQVYEFKVYQGWRQQYQGKFTTGPTLSAIKAPDPIFGKVFTKNSKDPAAGVVVYLQLATESTHSALLSTLTNSSGGWTIDLANFRTIDLKNPYAVNKKTTAKIMVDGGAKGKAVVSSTLKKNRLWSAVILK